MINHIYGVDYNTVARGGVGNPIVHVFPISTELFICEKDLVSRLAELQNDDLIINIKPFTTMLTRQEYKLKFK